MMGCQAVKGGAAEAVAVLWGGAVACAIEGGWLRGGKGAKGGGGRRGHEQLGAEQHLTG